MREICSLREGVPRSSSLGSVLSSPSRTLADTPLERRYPPVVGENDVPVDAMEVDEAETSSEAVKQYCRQTLLPKVRVMGGDESPIVGSEGTEWILSAFIDHEDCYYDEDEWDLLVTTITEDESSPEPWLEEDLEDGIVYQKDDILGKLREQQEEDPELCGPIIEALRKGSDYPDELPPGYKLDESGRLIYRSNPTGKYRLVIPRHLRKILLYEHHATPQAGHLGRDKTRGHMSSRYYWPGMIDDIDEWIGTCAVCVSRKPSPYGKVGRLHPLDATEPFSMWGMDLLELPTSTRKNKYLLIMTDYFTRWVEAIPLSNKEAITVAGVLYREIFCRYGAPQSILTDQGKEFNNELLSTLCLAYGVKKLMTTVKKSSTNGLTERFNRTLWDMLSKKGQEEQFKWDQHINACLYAYRSSVQASTGKSPYEVMFGQSMKLPADVALEPDAPKKSHDRFRILKADLGVGHEELEAQVLNQVRLNNKSFIEKQCAQSLSHKQQAQMERWNKKARELNVAPGQKVHIKSERGQSKVVAKKAKLNWEGPYTVLELQPRGNILVLKDHTPNAKPEVWHIQNVKPAWERKQRTRRKPHKLENKAVGALERLVMNDPGTLEVPLLCFRYGPAKATSLSSEVEMMET